MKISCTLYKKCRNKDCLNKQEQHISYFYLKSLTAGHTSFCKTCHKAKVKAWVKNNKAKALQYSYNWRKRNPKLVRAGENRYWAKNPDKLRTKWANHQIKRKYSNKFQLTSEQKLQIQEIYANRPVGYEVDHIIPLRGVNVWGLHAPWNLQYLTSEENRLKSNKILQGNQ